MNTESPATPQQEVDARGARTDDGLTEQQALSVAWAAYLVLLTLPFLVFLGLILYVADGERVPRDGSGQSWFIGTVVFFAITVPLAFFVRARLFRAYFDGGVVRPGDYLRGMLVVWITLDVAGLSSLAGCYVTATLMPNMLLALVAFVLFTPFWPSGAAMTDAVGGSDDPGVFKYPR